MSLKHLSKRNQEIGNETAQHTELFKIEVLLSHNHLLAISNAVHNYPNQTVTFEIDQTNLKTLIRKQPVTQTKYVKI